MMDETTIMNKNANESSANISHHDDDQDDYDDDHYNKMLERVLDQVKTFYNVHTEIKESHGISHVMAVHRHTVKAIESHNSNDNNSNNNNRNPQQQLSTEISMEIQIAALLHDVDDTKYFPPENYQDLVNASMIMTTAQIPVSNQINIKRMIHLVSCSINGNHVPDDILESSSSSSSQSFYYLLYPRWADRLEAVGAIGVIRCYQYNAEHQQPLYSPMSPKAQSIEDVWAMADPQRFIEYQSSGGKSGSQDMISHYYDKLLHIARPPPTIVQNQYLQDMAEQSSHELVQVCLRFGQSGIDDAVQYIESLMMAQTNTA